MNGIRFFRKKHHMTQNDLAKILGVKQTSVSQWETGRNYPDIKTAKRIAEMYDATLDQILGSEEMSEDDLRLSLGATSDCFGEIRRSQQRRYRIAGAETKTH